MLFTVTCSTIAKLECRGTLSIMGNGLVIMRILGIPHDLCLSSGCEHVMSICRSKHTFSDQLPFATESWKPLHIYRCLLVGLLLQLMQGVKAAIGDHSQMTELLFQHLKVSKLNGNSLHNSGISSAVMTAITCCLHMRIILLIDKDAQLEVQADLRIWRLSAQNKASTHHRHSCEQSLNLRFLPKILSVVEKPSLHHPATQHSNIAWLRKPVLQHHEWPCDNIIAMQLQQAKCQVSRVILTRKTRPLHHLVSWELRFSFTQFLENTHAIAKHRLDIRDSKPTILH